MTSPSDQPRDDAPTTPAPLGSSPLSPSPFGPFAKAEDSSPSPLEASAAEVATTPAVPAPRDVTATPPPGADASSVPPPGPTPPPPPVWERPDPLSFGPTTTEGPLVSPSVAAYQPAPPPPVPSTEPPTTAIGAPIPPSTPSAPSTPAPPPTPTPAPPAWESPAPPVSGVPTTAIPTPPPPASYYPPPAYQAPPGYAPTPYPAVEPGSGLPYSDKSKVVAGLLQLLLGFFLGVGGVGRLYAGNTTLGVTQLVLTLVAWASLFCGFFLIVPLLVFFGLWLWFWIDGIMMLAGRPVDGMGRPLRP